MGEFVVVLLQGLFIAFIIELIKIPVIERMIHWLAKFFERDDN